MKTLPFVHPYYKLQRDAFTTIRGKTYAKKFHIGETIQLLLIGCSPRQDVQAKVTGLEVKRVQDIPLPVLQVDAEYPGFRIPNHQAFVDLLNSLRRSFMPQARLDSEVTIIHLHRL